jgi:hypothetical protein
LVLALGVRLGPYEIVSPLGYGIDQFLPDYDVASDGRFLAIRREPVSQIHVVLNWTEELRRALTQ